MIGTVGQSFDHRAFDGAYSAAFLSRLKQILETRDWDEEFSSDRLTARAADSHSFKGGPREVQQPAFDRRLGHDGQGLGTGGRLSSPVRRAAETRAGRDPLRRPRRRALLQFRQHPLRHGDAHRRMGARQVLPLRALPCRRQAVPVGPGAAGQAHLIALDLRQRRRADHDDAGRDPPVDERAARLRQADQEGARALRHRQGAARHRHDGDRHAAGARGRGHRGRRRPAGPARCARDQDRGRDRIAQGGRLDGRRDLRRHRAAQSAPARRRTNSSPSPTTGCSAWAPSASNA